MTQEIVFDGKTQSLKNLAWWLYVFHGASLVFSLGMFSILPVIVSYVRRGDASGTFVYSHHTWQIRSFWWYVFWCAIGWILIFTFIGALIGVPILVIAWIWKAWRLIRGFNDLTQNRPAPV